MPKSIGVFRRGKLKKKKEIKDEDDEFVPEGVPVIDTGDENKNDTEPVDINDVVRSGTVDVDYDKAHRLYDRLSDEEKSFLAPHGNYVDSPNLLLRKGYVLDDMCFGFCDVYTSKVDPDTDSGDTGVLTVAVDPIARGNGLSYLVTKAAIEAGAKFGLVHYIYKVDKKNEPSIGLAKKLGGEIISEDDSLYKFKIN